MATQLQANAAVAIIDDEPANRIATRIQVEDAGFRPVIIEGGQYRNANELVATVRRQAQAAVCDHRLSHRAFAQFSGAEAVAALVENRVPAILVTRFRKHDIQTNIRRWRRYIPVLLSKDELDPTAVSSGLAKCLNEIANDAPPERTPRRTLVRIAGSDRGIVDAFLPQWNPDEAVQFPVELLPERYRPGREGQRFIAQVNIGARNDDELFLVDFELAPDPDPEDGLG